MNNQILTATLTAIDAINALDPSTELVEGVETPKELIYGQRMSTMVQRFLPQASEELQIACRGQHISRWQFPRSEFPAGRVGYLTWRKELYTYHAKTTAQVATTCGATREEAAVINETMKEKVSGKDQSQHLEDVACLVFLEHYFADFITKFEEEKLTRIIQKTWNKMSEDAQKFSGQLSFTQAEEAALAKALS